MAAERDRLNDRKTELTALAELEREIIQEEIRLERTREEYTRLSAEYEASEREYDGAYKAYLDGQAGVLALSLEEGRPCPVCGSTVHPSPAARAERVPTETRLNELKRRAGEARERAEKAARTAKGEAAALEERKKTAASRRVLLNVTGDAEEEIGRTAKHMSDIVKRLEDAEKRRSRKNELNAVVAQCEKSLSDAQKALGELRVENAARAEKRRGAEDRLKALRARLRFADAARARVRAEEITAEKARLARASETARAALTAAERDIAVSDSKKTQLRKQVAAGGEDVADELRARRAAYAAHRKELTDGMNDVNARLISDRRALVGMESEAKALEDAERRLARTRALSDTANGNLSGKEKISLEAYVQATYFDRIIARANIRLMMMTDGQYELKRRLGADNNKSQSGLELNVIDHYNGSERDVRSLSGGESFKASLSLALGLSDEIQSSAGGVRLDSMFVDEGFGSLDEGSLAQAINALASLTEGDRLVGIISHVSELRSRIDKQIAVVKDRTGGSKATLIV